MPPDTLLQQFPGEVLPWLRGRLGLTQADLAVRLGVATRTVADWETGRRRIALPYHRRIVPYLARHLATDEGAAFARALAGE